MSSNSDPRPVVVLTAGGVGTSKSYKTTSSKKKRQQQQPKQVVGVVDATAPEGRESHDSVLDRKDTNEQQAPFLDEPVELSGEQDNAAVMAQTSSKGTANPPLPPLDRHSSTGSVHQQQQHNQHHSNTKNSGELVWLFICFLGIMASFVCYGLLLEYATSGGRELHELSFLFVTSGLYTMTAAAGRYVRDETPTTIPPARFAILGLTSMGSTFFSVRSLRYVIYPVQVLAKSCKPVPVMLMGAAMGKKYSVRKYINVCLIVLGVALFMGGGGGSHKSKGDDDHVDVDGHSSNEANVDTTQTDETTDATAAASQIIGIVLLFISLCCDGGTGAYEDKLMSVHSVQPFDLMFNIQMGKTILAGIGLLVLNQIHIFIQMCNDMGFLLVALGLSGALGQVFIFVTIAKFGALTCSIIGLARKITTLVASIWFYGHELGPIQFLGLVISVGAMVLNFYKGKSQHHGGPPTKQDPMTVEELQSMLDSPYEDKQDEDDVEMTATPGKDEEAAFALARS